MPGNAPVPLPSPSNSPPRMDRQTEFALVNSLWLDVTSSSFAATSTPAAIVDKVKETGRIFERAVLTSGAAEAEKAALCSMWQHYDHSFSDILHALLQQVKVNKKLIAQRQTDQQQFAAKAELPSLKSTLSPSLPSPTAPFLQKPTLKRAATLAATQTSSPKVESSAARLSSPAPATTITAGRGKAQAAEEALVQLEMRLKREQEERESEAEKFKRKIDFLEADKRHLKIEVANLEQVINAQLHVVKNSVEGELHFRRSDYSDLPVVDLMSIETKSQEVEQVMRDIEQEFGEGEDLLLRLNFMMRKLQTDETLRAGGQDLEGMNLDIVNIRLKAELSTAKKLISTLQQQSQEARDRAKSLEKTLQNKKLEMLQLVSQLNGVSMEEAEEMVRNKGNGALTEGIAKQRGNETKVYEGKSIRVQPMPAGRWPTEVAVTIERFGIEIAVRKYGGATIDKFLSMSMLPQNMEWNEEDMPTGHNLLRAMVASAQNGMPLLLKQLAGQLQSIVAKMQTSAETAVGQRVGDGGEEQPQEAWKKGAIKVLGAVGKLKRKVDVFRGAHETMEERATASRKFVSKALDPKSSASMTELLHEVSVVMNLKMKTDEEHSVLLQQQVGPHPPMCNTCLSSRVSSAYRKPHDRCCLSLPLPHSTSSTAHPGSRVHHVLHLHHWTPQRSCLLRESARRRRSLPPRQPLALVFLLHFDVYGRSVCAVAPSCR